ncbi:transglycosylase SLT domain-containing protein [Rhodanobacter koreensis]
MNRARNATPPHRLGVVLLAVCLLALGGCATTAPPRDSQDICQVFEQYPSWYRDAHAAQQRWGTPVNVLMAFVRRESGFRRKVRPDRPRFLFIPLPRKSSAYGYAQAQDPIWRDYLKATGGWFKRRTDMDDALDFLGWYTDRIHRELGISKWDPEHLYIAYHEGIGGYRDGHWRHDSHLLQTAATVAYLAREYGEQLKRCK